jgi:hypothetical protein
MGSRKIQLGVLGAAVVMAVVIATGAASASSNITEATTLHVQLRGGKSTFIDTGKTGPSPGDRVVLNQPAYFASNPSKQVGTGVVTVTLVGGANESQDVATLVLPGGQIDVEGIQGNSNTFTLGVTGGTGAYQNARGQVHVSLLPHNVSNVTANLIP